MRAILAWLLVAASTASAQERAAIDAASHVDDDRWRLYAVEYARSEGVPARRLIEGADGRVAMSWYFFVAVGHGHVVLVDTGTDALGSDEGRRRAWSVERATGVIEALARVGVTPPQVTDVVLTHHHWDHVGGLPHFTRARVHVHAGEWRRVPERLRRPVERTHRLDALDGSREALFDGLTVFEAGRHTRHQLMVELRCTSGPRIIAGDAAYLYRNIETHRPVAVTSDARRNVADVAAAVDEVGADHVVPGHDPAVFERFASPTEGVAAICP